MTNLGADQVREGAVHKFFKIDRDGTLAEYTNLAAFPAVGVPNRLYLAIDTVKLYRWNGAAYTSLAVAIADVPGLQTALDVGWSWPKVWPGQNYWYELPAAGGNNGTQGTTLSRAYALPVLVPVGCTLSDVVCEVTTVGAAGAVLRAGLYGATTAGLPGALVSEAAATVVATTVGVKTFTFTPNQALVAGALYFIVIASQVALCTVRVRNTNEPLVVTTATPTGFLNYTSYYGTMAGAMPASFGAPTGTTPGPSAYLRLT